MPHQLCGTTSSNDINIFITNLITPKIMINYKIAKKYCSEDISLIENYAQAALDATQIWDIHHRKEIDENKSRTQLKNENLIYARPASELIFLTHSEHISIHQKHKMTDEYKSYLSDKFSGENNPQFGVEWSNDRKARLSNTRKAKIASGKIKVDTSACHAEDACKKISDKAKERLANPENHPMFRKHQSEETKRKISEAKKGKVPWNKGKKMKKRG